MVRHKTSLCIFLATVPELTAVCLFSVLAPDLPPETRTQLIEALKGWNFEPSTLLDEHHVASCALLFFEALFRIDGMQEAVGVSLGVSISFPLFSHSLFYFLHFFLNCRKLIPTR